MLPQRVYAEVNLDAICQNIQNAMKKVGPDTKIMAIIKTQFTLRLGLESHAKLKKIAQAEYRSMTNMIEYLVKKEIDRYERENGPIELTEEDLFGPESGG